MGICYEGRCGVNKELLEKMQYLHKCGLEADRAISKDCVIITVKPYNEVESELFQPYFSESCLWSLLRRILDIESIDMYQIVLRYTTNNQGELKRTVFNMKNLHVALLDTTIWAVKERYLKAEVKSE